MRQNIKITCVLLASKFCLGVFAQAAMPIHVVNLRGQPVAKLTVSLAVREGKNFRVLPLNSSPTETLPNGVAFFSVDEQTRMNPPEFILVNMPGDGRPKNPSYIGRAKRISWSLERELIGFAVPVWTKGEVNTVGTAIVEDKAPAPFQAGRPQAKALFVGANGRRVAVVLGFRSESGDDAEIVARVEGDVDDWISKYAQDLPRVQDAEFARMLFHELYAGEAVPPRYNARMRAVAEEAARQNEAMRLCRRFPQNALGLDQNDPPLPPNNVAPPMQRGDEAFPGSPPSFSAGLPPGAVAPASSPIGRVVIHNRSPCQYVARVNEQYVQVRPGGATSVHVTTGNVVVGVARPNSPHRYWNHWILVNSEPVLTLHTHFQVLRPQQGPASHGRPMFNPMRFTGGAKASTSRASPFKLAQYVGRPGEGVPNAGNGSRGAAMGVESQPSLSQPFWPFGSAGSPSGTYNSLGGRLQVIPHQLPQQSPGTPWGRFPAAAENCVVDILAIPQNLF